MKLSVSSDLRTALWGVNLCAAYDVFTITLPSGALLWTSHNANVTVGATTWSATAPTINIPAGVSDVGLATDTRDVTLGGAFTVGGQTLQQLARAGAFDDASFLWQRAFSTSGAIVGIETEFDGVVVDAQPRSTNVRLRVKSRVADLEQVVPFRPMQVQCPWVFGDLPTCGHTKLAGETCDRTTGKCLTYSNIAKHGGFSRMPRSEAT